MSNNKFIITGGPGSGKTSLLNELAQHGFTLFEEVSRELIREQAAKQDGLLPWTNMPGFANLAMKGMRIQYLSSSLMETTCIFDRGIPDIIGYLRWSGHAEHAREVVELCKIYPYNQQVFICPPWEAIYVNDQERPQHFREAQQLFKHIYTAYEELGYELIDVPLTDIAQRTTFIVNEIMKYEDSELNNLID